MQAFFEQTVQLLGILAITGLIIAIFYYLLKAAAGYILITIGVGFVFMEVYEVYLFFTERYRYTEDLAANGLWRFTGFYIALNLLILLGILVKVIRNRNA
ncbi:TPA: DUF5966 family protein [Streptococcus agalactiae]